MIKGMTGFGSSQFSTGNIKGVVEVKTLNHRYLDITYYLPIGFGSMEDKIKQIIQRSMNRGRVTVSVKITQKHSSVLKVNRSLVKQYVDQMRKIGREFRLKGDPSLADIIKLPGVVEISDQTAEAMVTWSLLEKAVKKTLASVVQMRQREGASLSKDIQKQLKLMHTHIKHIQARSKSILDAKRSELSAEEFASFQKSNDVNEELARLAHYIDEVKILLRSSVVVGKKIDFIAQEMQRETNTVGSKLQDKLVSNAVIALKSKVEKIREQSQNIE